MTSVSADRRYGVNSSMAVKVPCACATTVNITLSGEQTIDGVTTANSRVLVWNQTDPTENGIYDSDTGAWSRSLDFDGAYDVVTGTLVSIVPGGTQNGGAWFICSSTGVITIGTSSITFTRQNINNVTKTSQTATAGQTAITVATYQPGANSAQVFLDGIRVRVGVDYTETSTTVITFLYALLSGQEVDVYTGMSVGNLTAAAASSVAITDAGDFYVGTTVEQVLQEIASGINADVGNVSATLTYNASARVQRWNTPLTANRTASLSTSNAKEGASFVIVRGSGATGNYTLAVGTGPLATLYAPGEWCEVRYDAGTAAWILEKYGKLPSAALDTLTLDNGDADATLAVSTSPAVQRWGTVLTAERVCTLSTTGAWPGAKFRIFRAATATGGFSLTVIQSGAGAAICRLAPGQYCDVIYSGTTWLPDAFGDVQPKNPALMSLLDDFTGNEIDGFKWQSYQGTDSSCQQAIVYADQTNGLIRLTTGADAGATMALNGSQTQSNLNWKANKGGLMCEFTLTLDAITAIALFIGFTDQDSVLEMPFILAAGDILTSNASDAVGVLFDTAADTDNWWLMGVAADIDATKQNTTVAPVAATAETWRIELSAIGTATFYRNGAVIGTAMTGAVTPSVLQTPVVAAFSRGAASRNIDVDRIMVQQQR